MRKGKQVDSAAFLASTDNELITGMEINLLGIKVCPQRAHLQQTKASSPAADPEARVCYRDRSEQLRTDGLKAYGGQTSGLAAKCYQYSFLGVLYFGNLGTKWFCCLVGFFLKASTL